MQQVLGHLPDGLAITTSTLRVLSANATFLRMVQEVEDRQVVGQHLSGWIARSGAELNMLQSNLKRHGVARNFATVIRDRFGGEDEVEISAVAAELDGETVFGFAIRPVSRRLVPAENSSDWQPGREKELTSLVGQMPLKDIVRASTDLIEKVCIETALELSDQSRASAAELLGLSRQGLYSKLKRFKISATE
jgi:transcriptional regulator PpsR